MSERLTHWECERLLMNRSGSSVRPDTSWAETFWRIPDPPHGLSIYEPIRTKAASWARPHVCLNITVQFLGRRGFEEVDRVEIEAKRWPTTHFALWDGKFYEVSSGSVRHTSGEWFFIWYAAKNTAHARHFNIHPNHLEWDSGRCDVCRLEKNLPEAA